MARSNAVSDKETEKPKLTWDKLKQSLQVFRFIRPYRWHFILGLVLLFLSSLVFMVFPYLSGLMIDVAQGNSQYKLDLSTIGLGLVGILVIQGVVSFARVMLFAYVSEKGIADLRNELYTKLVSLPITFFESSQSGEVVSRVTSDAERLYSTFSITLAEFIRQVIILVIGIVFLAVTTPKLALIMLTTFPVIVIGAMIFGRSIRKLSKERQNAMAESNTILGESVQSIASVKAFTNEWFERQRYSQAMRGLVTVALKFARGRAIFSVFIIVVLFGALFFIIWMGAYLLSKGDITAGQLVSFVSYTAILGGAIAGLGNFYTEIVGAVGATERVREILAMPGEVTQLDAPVRAGERLKGRIQLDQIHFHYPSRPDVEVLKGVSLEILPGQKAALVGHSGAGKSTIVQLLLRFYKPDTGSIYLDGTPLDSMDISTSRSQMAIVPQEVLLFGGSIRDNIRYGNPGATEEQIIEAARQAYAWEFIQGFPEGLDTIVGERGIKLSGGQRQRIAIARAILKDPAILLLDEATSSLDAESEKEVQRALNNLMEGRTSIIIAHRLATIREVDQIFVLDEGRIVEQGTHEQLSEIEDGIYNQLAKLQFSGVS